MMQVSNTVQIPEHATICNAGVPVAARKRSRRCGECVGCKSENCEKCSACRDMTKYGGSGKKKQFCVNRHCTGKG